MSIFLVCASCGHLQCLESEKNKINPLHICIKSGKIATKKMPIMRPNC